MERYPIPTLGVFVKEVIDPNPGVDRVRVDREILQIDRKLVNDGRKLDVMLRIEWLDQPIAIAYLVLGNRHPRSLHHQGGLLLAFAGSVEVGSCLC